MVVSGVTAYVLIAIAFFPWENRDRSTVSGVPLGPSGGQVGNPNRFAIRSHVFVVSRHTAVATFRELPGSPIAP